MKRHLPLLFFALTLAAGLLAWRYHNVTSPSHILSDPDNAAPPTREPQPDAGSPQNTAAPTPAPEGVSAAFVSFLAAESKSIESPQIDADLAQQRMEQNAAAMGEKEIQYARDLVAGPQNPANQRIVAASMLGLAGEKAWGAAREIVVPEFESKRAEPHSVDEVKNSQAKALALMLVDALAEQAVKSQKARDELQRWAKEAKDSTVQKHIAKKIRELPAL